MISVNADTLNDLGRLIDLASQGGERVQLERQGKPVAAIISAQDLARLEALEDRLDSVALRLAMAESKGLVTIDELLTLRPIEE